VPLVSFPRRLADLAADAPDSPAVTCDTEHITRIELERRSNRLARALANRGVGEGSMVTIGLPNSIDWVVAAAAIWKLGAVPQPVSHRLPRRELEAIVELADPAAVMGFDPAVLPGRVCLPAGFEPEADLADGPLPDRVSPAWNAPTSGGSTGRPKLIVSGVPAQVDPQGTAPFAMQRDGCLVMPGPLYHNGPIVFAVFALLWGNHLVLLPRFDAEATLDSIGRFRADVLYLVPTMMRRILRLPEDVRQKADLGSLRFVWHLAEPCPVWLKQAWIDWLGPERILELYAGTEGQAMTIISGVEWLSHRGSVGRPVSGEMMVCDPEGNRLPPGEHGEVWLRNTRDQPTYRYVGAEAKRLGDGWESLGDMGYMDDDGYLYLGDRVQDMILVGGANVYPAEVEAALQEHPAVRSCAVIGLPDEDKGNRIHAIVEADPAEVGADELRGFAAERLASYKVPRTVELVTEPLRNDAGKVRRAELRQARLAEAGSA